MTQDLTPFHKERKPLIALFLKKNKNPSSDFSFFLNDS